MPFFRPLSKEERYKYLTNGKIEAALERLGDKGFQYCKTDVRWRHVGVYDNQIVMFDLADLSPLGAKGKNKMVQKCLSTLRERCNDEFFMPIPAVVDCGNEDEGGKKE